MTGSVQSNVNDGRFEVAVDGPGRAMTKDKAIKFAMSGCHDTTLAAVLSSLGAFQGEKWPPYTSHIALELFREGSIPHSSDDVPGAAVERRNAISPTANPSPGIFGSLYGKIFGRQGEGIKQPIVAKEPLSQGIERKRTDELSAEEKSALKGYYVRVRYNDRPMTIPGCRLAGNHLEGNESFCTLVRIGQVVEY